MATSASKGREQRRTSPKGRIRIDARKVFAANLPAINVETHEFAFHAITEDGESKIDDAVIDCAWTDEAGPEATPILTGTLTVREPQKDEVNVNIDEGHVVRCSVRWGKGWRNVWSMRIWSASRNVADGSISFELYDDLYLLQRSRDTFDYKRSKKGRRRKGWRAHEITADVARRYHFKLGKVVRGRHFIRNLDLPDKTTSPYKAIREAYKREVEHSGKAVRFVWRNNRLSILAVEDRRTPWVFSSQLTNVTVSRERKEKFCTAYTLYGKGEGKKGKPIEVTIDDDKMVRKFGYIHKSASSKQDSVAELRRQAKLNLADRMYRPRKVTFEHPGVPFLEAGDPLQLSVPEQGIIGKQGVCFAARIEHALSAGSYTMTVEAQFDPFRSRSDLIDKDMQDRKKKRAKKAKNKPKPKDD